MQLSHISLACAVVALALAGCSKTTGIGGTASDASPTTLQANAQFAKDLNLQDPQDFDCLLYTSDAADD